MRRHDVLDQQQPAIGPDGGPTVSQDPLRGGVVPIVNDVGQNIDVAIWRQRAVKQIAADQIYTTCGTAQRQRGASFFDDGWGSTTGG